MEDDQITVSIFANILAQLVDRKRSASYKTSALYKSESFSNGKASVKAYQNAVRAEVDRFSKVFLIVDGLDMAADRDRVLNRLQRLPEHVQLLFALRDSKHANKANCIPIHAPHADLEEYIESRITNDAVLANILAQYPRGYGLREAFIQQVTGRCHGL